MGNTPQRRVRWAPDRTAVARGAAARAWGARTGEQLDKLMDEADFVAGRALAVAQGIASRMPGRGVARRSGVRGEVGLFRDAPDGAPRQGLDPNQKQKKGRLQGAAQVGTLTTKKLAERQPVGAVPGDPGDPQHDDDQDE